MTNEEKFRKGKVLYKNEEEDYILELWGASTKHPDSIFNMKNFKMSPYIDKNDDREVRTQLLQWIFECASKLTFITHAISLVEWGLENHENWINNGVD